MFYILRGKYLQRFISVIKKLLISKFACKKFIKKKEEEEH